MCVVNSRQDLLILFLVLLILFRGSPLPHFGTTYTHTNTHLHNMYLYIYQALGPHLQVRLNTIRLTRDVRTFLLAAEQEDRWKKIPLYDVDSFFPSAPTRYENSCRGARIADSCWLCPRHRAKETDRKNSLRSTRVSAARFTLLPFYFLLFSLLQRDISVSVKPAIITPTQARQ